MGQGPQNRVVTTTEGDAQYFSESHDVSLEYTNPYEMCQTDQSLVEQVHICPLEQNDRYTTFLCSFVYLSPLPSGKIHLVELET